MPAVAAAREQSGAPYLAVMRRGGLPVLASYREPHRATREHGAKRRVTTIISAFTSVSGFPRARALRHRVRTGGQGNGVNEPPC
jgi:hypothetical protein